MHLRKHDANISIYDGKKLHYFAFERELGGEKHCGIKDFNEINIYPSKTYSVFLQEYLKLIGIEKDRILAIAIGDSNWELNTNNDIYEKVSWLDDLSNEVYFVDHHYAHHLSCFDSKNSWVLDGNSNDLRYSTIYKDNKIKEILKDPENGHSFGFVLENFSEEILKTINGAGHAMALCSLGKIEEDFFERFKNDDLTNSHINMNMLLFNKYYTKKHFDKINSNIWFDYIKTIHEIAKINHVSYLKKFFKTNDSFVFTGGVSQSIVLNTHFKKIFPNIEITPHGYDGGVSLGLIKFLTNKKNYQTPNLHNFPFIQADEHPGYPKKETIVKTAEYLSQGKIVLWYQGNGEIGPRALGNRSILANPLIKDMKEQVNNKVKKRAWFRPYGASVLLEDYKKYFDLDWESPYMLYQADVKEREKLKSITHFDGTCRIQTVSSNHVVFYELLQNFKKLTGIPILLNTSYNLPGKPIVGNIKDAKITFEDSKADVLVIGDDIYLK